MGDPEVIIVVLIPILHVPADHNPQTLSVKTPSCELMVEMFIDVDSSCFFDCPHNTAQLRKIINYMFSWYDYFSKFGDFLKIRHKALDLQSPFPKWPMMQIFLTYFFLNFGKLMLPSSCIFLHFVPDKFTKIKSENNVIKYVYFISLYKNHFH